MDFCSYPPAHLIDFWSLVTSNNAIPLHLAAVQLRLSLIFQMLALLAFNL